MPVQLMQLPEHRMTTIVVGTSLRKRADILSAYFASLAAQELPPNTRLVPVFVNDGLSIEARAIADAFIHERKGELLRGIPAGGADFSDDHPDTHQWSAPAMARVGANKDRILERARQLNADYVWFCDADLICDTTTLKSMLSVAAPIVTAVYWTRWSRRGSETRKVHAAPQVWLRHPYELSGRGFGEAEFRQRLAERRVTRVAGYGACTLLARVALDAGVSFAQLADVPPVGLMGGEDRHFCIRAERMHLEALADPWPDIFHIYHIAEDVPRIADMQARLSQRHSLIPSFGDLVSLTIEALEPFPRGPGQWQAIPPQRVRGRLGQIPLVIELEEAVYDLERGKDVIVPVHFPAHYPVPYYAGKRRLLRVTLHDTKPFGFPPTLEDELIAGLRSRAFLRSVDYTERQLNGMRENAEAHSG